LKQWRRIVLIVGLVGAWWAVACAVSPPPPPEVPPEVQPRAKTVDRSDAQSLPAWELDNPLHPLPEPPLGITARLQDLPSPPTPETVRLGRWLFFDGRLSSDGTVSCATCHQPEHAFSDAKPRAVGVEGRVGTRKAPSVVNLAYPTKPHFFWDGRADSLEAQAVGPMMNHSEMGNAEPEVVLARLQSIQGYRTAFARAFGDERIDLNRVAKAIADYERTRMSGDSPWDRWQAKMDEGDAAILAKIARAALPASDYEETAGESTQSDPDKSLADFRDGKHISASVKRGHALFHGKASCNTCHLGPTFSDSQFHNLGIGFDSKKGTFSDDGRFAVTRDPADRGSFKTPSLRDLAKRAPYLHDGSAATLREVVELYDKGGIANPNLSPKIKPLGLNERDITDLLAFLSALEGTGYHDAGPSAFPQ
jgi:cytochrome c peroxidase